MSEKRFDNEKMKIGKQFKDDIYQILTYVCKQSLEDVSFKENTYFYTELFEHFEEVVELLIHIKRVLNVYDDIDEDTIGFSITQDINDFNVEHMSQEVLIMLRDKIDKQIEENNKLFKRSEN